jgi:hypothetical protein
MTTYFDQEGQQVQNQTNVVGDVGAVNFQGVSDRTGLVAGLQQIRAELARASRQGAIDQDLAGDADAHVTRALDQARQTQPDRARFLDHLAQAQALLKTAASAAGLITALDKAAELARQLF